MDPATAATPVAADAAQVRSLAGSAGTLADLTARQSVCRACPRLVRCREEVAEVRRKSFRDQQYWGRPIAGWGDPAPSVLMVGLAPAAHGGNRTGRIFTGDRRGDFLFASLYRCGLASQPTSVRAGDGQRLIGARMVAPTLRTIVALGGFAWQALWLVLATVGYDVPRPRPAFAHGAESAARSVGGQASPSSAATTRASKHFHRPRHSRHA